MMYGVMLHLASLKDGVPEFDVTVLRIPHDDRDLVSAKAFDKCIWSDLMVIDAPASPEFGMVIAQALAAVHKDIAKLPSDDDDNLAGEDRRKVDARYQDS